MRLFVLLGIFLVAANGQSPQPDNDPKQLLLEVRRKVMLTIEQLPRYMCTETVERITFRPKESLAETSCDDLVSRKRQKDPARVSKYTADRLRLDVAMSGDGEMYSWAGENRFEDKSLATLVHGGATSTGTFVAFLRSIFGGDAATFTFNGQVSDRESVLIEYGFRVPLHNSQYTIRNGEVGARVAFDGTFLVDPKTSNLVRLNVRADQLPPELRICDDTTALEYSVVRLHDSEFFLPNEIHWHIVNANGSELENESTFSACREFRGESSLSFSTQINQQPELHGSQGNRVILPAGLQFTVALSNAIDVAHSAAGDAIRGKLTTTLRQARGKILIPKGAIVAGRILRLERIYNPGWETVKVAVGFETVEVHGAPERFYANLDPVIKHTHQIPAPSRDESVRIRQKLGTFGEMLDSSDAAVGVIEFDDVTEDYVIKPGLQISGTTAAARDDKSHQ